jgi:hypothetical protein
MLKTLLLNTDFDIRNIINATLVEYGGRPGTLIQHADYMEPNASGPIMKQNLNALKTLYPDLHHTWIGQGMLITKYPVPTDLSYWTTKHTGEILGYIEPLETLDISNNSSVQIYVKLKLFPNVINITGMIITTPCNDKLDSLIATYKTTLSKSPLFVNEIQEITYRIDEHISEEILIDKLINEEHIHENYCSEIRNYIYNISLESFMEYDFKYKNQLHIGILISLLLQHKYDPCTPFFPINESPYGNLFIKATASYEQHLIDFLENNNIQSSILNKLRNMPNTLTHNEKRTLSKNISRWGKGDSIVLKDLASYPFDYTNKIHVGIVATLYILKSHNPLNAFECVQTPIKLTKIAKYYSSYETAILDVASNVTHTDPKSSSNISKSLSFIKQNGCNIQ